MRQVGTEQTINEYEKIRNARVAQNATKLEMLGIQNIVKSLSSAEERRKNKTRKRKEQLAKEDAKDMEYIPTDNDEEDNPLNVELPPKVPKSNNRQRAHYIPPRSMKKYSSCVNTRLSSSNVNNSYKPQQGLDTNLLFDKEWTCERPNTQGKSISHKNNEKITTMADLILQKNKTSHFSSATEDTNTRLERQNIFVQTLPIYEDQHGLHQPFHNEGSSVFNKDGDIASHLEMNFEDGNIPTESGDEITETESEQLELDNQHLELAATLLNKKRGPTMLHHVHTRPFEKRKAIILNEFGQPIGPITEEEDTVAEFSGFLGTIARDYDYAPLTHKSWRKVPRKEKMWEYVLRKYIVPDEGKEWVLKTIGAAWRLHKCRFKKRHYYKYADDRARWKNRSKTVPDEDFKKLLSTWKKIDEQLRCSRNRARRLSQKNMHTAGPKSFATIREKMKNEHPNKEPPSLADLFERTRKRNEGKKYIEPYDDTAKKIDDMKNYVPPEDGSGPSDPFLGVMGKDYNGRRRLFGRGVCNTKLDKVNGTGMSYMVPVEILESLKSNLVEDVRKDMDYEITKVEEMRREMDEDYLKKKTELENMQRDLDSQKESMTEEIMRKILGKLPPDVARQYFT